MRTHLLILLSAIGLLLASQFSTPAVEEQKESPKFAVIDINKVLENSAPLQRGLEGLQKENEAQEERVERSRAKIETLREELSYVQPTSSEYASIDEQIVEAEAELAQTMKTWENKRQRREAKLYHDAYADIHTRVDRFALRYGVRLVVNYDSHEIDKSVPEDVMSALSRDVVFHRRLDITSHIINERTEPFK